MKADIRFAAMRQRNDAQRAWRRERLAMFPPAEHANWTLLAGDIDPDEPYKELDVNAFSTWANNPPVHAPQTEYGRGFAEYVDEHLRINAPTVDIWAEGKRTGDFVAEDEPRRDDIGHFVFPRGSYTIGKPDGH